MRERLKNLIACCLLDLELPCKINIDFSAGADFLGGGGRLKISVKRPSVIPNHNLVCENTKASLVAHQCSPRLGKSAPSRPMRIDLRENLIHAKTFHVIFITGRDLACERMEMVSR